MKIRISKNKNDMSKEAILKDIGDFFTVALGLEGIKAKEFPRQEYVDDVKRRINYLKEHKPAPEWALPATGAILGTGLAGGAGRMLGSKSKAIPMAGFGIGGILGHIIAKNLKRKK